MKPIGPWLVGAMDDKLYTPATSRLIALDVPSSHPATDRP